MISEQKTLASYKEKLIIAERKYKGRLSNDASMGILSIGCRISADCRISHWIVNPLSESRIRICYYPKIVGYQNRISDIRQSFVAT